MQKSRDRFIDIIKIYACILVVLGHFFMSMTAAKIIEDTFVVEWFIKTIYYFHVPLFFICSGYLYQKYSKVNDFSQWKNNAVKKLVSFSVPYAVFSTITWILKSVFSSSVNSEVDGYFSSLFLNPISPYWYLYTLFFVFLFTLTFKSRKSALTMLMVSLVAKCIAFVISDCNIFVLTSVLNNEIWFVMGMCLCICGTSERIKETRSTIIGVVLAVVFIGASVAVYVTNYDYEPVCFVMGVLACVATVIFAIKLEDNKLICKITKVSSKYTMPVFLMHTIFAAGLRAVLIKIGIENSVVHIVLGILISFIGPIVATLIMSRIKGLDFVLYPTKYINLKPRSKSDG